MGSNNSTNIKPIPRDIDQEKDCISRDDDRKSTNDHRTSTVAKQRTKENSKTSDFVTPFTTDAEGEIKDSKDVEQLEKQLDAERQQFSELERQNLELQDYIENLESQLEAIDRHNELKGNASDNFTESLKIKEQTVLKLEKENETLKAEMAKLRIKFKKKVRSFNTKLTEEKNETSVRALEVKEEMEALREQNAKLHEQVLRGGAGTASASEQQQSHTHVILELSTKVSEQDALIVQLQNRVNEKDKQIERLQKSKKNMSRERQPLKEAMEGADAEQPAPTDNWAPDESLKQDPLLRSQSNFEGSTDWYGSRTFEQISRQSTSNVLTTPQSSSRSFPGRDVPRKEETESSRSELAAIAEEMKQLRKKKTRSKRFNAAFRSPAHERSDENGGASGRDSGLSVESNSPIANGASHNGYQRNGSGVSRTSSVFSYDSVGHEKPGRKQSPNASMSLNRPPSGGIKYDADISHCDTDMGLSDNSDKDTDKDYAESSRSTGTPVDRSSIRQISAPKTKKRKGLLKTLVRKESVPMDDSRGEEGLNGGVRQKPPLYKVAPRDGAVAEADTLIHSIDEELLRHNKGAASSFQLTAVS